MTSTTFFRLLRFFRQTEILQTGYSRAFPHTFELCEISEESELSPSQALTASPSRVPNTANPAPLHRRRAPETSQRREARENYMQHDFQQFLRGLRADARLGRYVPNVPNQTAESLILMLVWRLADAAEGKQPHPAHELLERIGDQHQGLSPSPTNNTNTSTETQSL